MLQKRTRSPAPFPALQQLDYVFFFVAVSLVHDHLQSIYVANKICLSYVTNIPKVMGLACDTFVVSYLNTGHAIFKICFSKTEARN